MINSVFCIKYNIIQFFLYIKNEKIFQRRLNRFSFISRTRYNIFMILLALLSCHEMHVPTSTLRRVKSRGTRLTSFELFTANGGTMSHVLYELD